MIEQIPGLANLGNVVPADYNYYEKLIASAQDLSLSTAYLKWYNLYPVANPITEIQLAETRAFIEAEVAADRLKLEHELGFVILHRAGAVLLLLITTWRNTNEMWESTWFKQTDSTNPYELIQYPTTHRGTYCVWELGIVWHERHAWVRFLSSTRDDAAKLAYINDRMSGSI